MPVDPVVRVGSPLGDAAGPAGASDTDFDVEEVDENVCEECGFSAASAGGLATHKRSHE